MSKRRTTLYIDDSVWKKLRHIAIERGISTSQLVEELIKKETEKTQKIK